MTNDEGLLIKLRTIVSDPMWADHCEISKRTLQAAIDRIENLEAEIRFVKMALRSLGRLE